MSRISDEIEEAMALRRDKRRKRQGLFLRFQRTGPFIPVVYEENLDIEENGQTFVDAAAYPYAVVTLDTMELVAAVNGPDPFNWHSECKYLQADAVEDMNAEVQAFRAKLFHNLYKGRPSY